MGGSIQKYFLGIISVAVTCIAIELLPVSKRASSWNNCIEKTKETLDNLLLLS